MRRVGTALLFLFLVYALVSPARTFAEYRQDANLAPRVDAILSNAKSLKGGIQGIVVQRVADGAVLYEKNADTLMIPASNQKLLTSAAALSLLGPDWRYATRVLRRGAVDKTGVLHGDVYLVGSGDPTLSVRDLVDLAASIKKTGISRITGRVYGDDSRFDRQRYGDGWAWDDMPYYYSPQVSALCLNENAVMVTTAPGKHPGDPIRFIVEPTTHYMKIVNRAKTIGKGGESRLDIGRELGKNRIVVTGVLPIDDRADGRTRVPITIESPARYTAVVFTECLQAAHIQVDSQASEGTCATGLVEVTRHLSPPISEMLRRLNKPSDNLMAECFLKTLGAETSAAHVGSYSSGREAVLAWLKAIGMEMDGVAIADGSGLSRQNFVTPRNLAKVLMAMTKDPHFSVIYDSLPVAGVDGTLRKRMKGTDAEGNCRAKSGYVSSVSTLSGYVKTKSGEMLVFSIMMNNHKAKNVDAMAVQNIIVETLASM